MPLATGRRETFSPQYHLGVKPMTASRAGHLQQDGAGAAAEILAGEPGPAARHWLGPVAVAAFALFVINIIFVLSGDSRAVFDVPVERAVQQLPWGPLTYWMTLTNITGGLIQDLFGAAVVVALFLWERRAGYLMALGAIGSLIDQVVKVSIQRHRPTADLVTILNPSSGYSYPSGHAVFFTWLCFMLAASVSPNVRRRWRAWLWTTAGVVIFLACTGRVWAGAHWPTDVIGGFLLGLGWSAFILWLPERWLPTPTRRWVRRHRLPAGDSRIVPPAGPRRAEVHSLTYGGQPCARPQSPESSP
jgi:undecaprenyl-diphosphatase